MTNDMPDAKASALEALLKAASQRPDGGRVSPATIRTVVDIAWRHQFEPSERAVAREELRAALAPEFHRAVEEPK